MENLGIANQYIRILAEEGFVGKIDKDGDVVFKFEGKSYFIQMDSSDEEVFRLVFPNFWSIDSDRERIMVTMACIKATSKTKVAKVFPVGDAVWASIELFVAFPEAIQPVLMRSMSAIRAGVKNFAEAIEEMNS